MVFRRDPFDLEQWFNFLPKIRLESPVKGAREPLIDVIDEGDKIKVVAELPGVKKDDIELSIEPLFVTLRVKAGEEMKEEKEGYYYRERSYESFYRSFRLPSEVLPESAKAEYNNGILEIELEKKDKKDKKDKGFKVEIK